MKPFQDLILVPICFGTELYYVVDRQWFAVSIAIMRERRDQTNGVEVRFECWIRSQVSVNFLWWRHVLDEMWQSL